MSEFPHLQGLVDGLHELHPARAELVDLLSLVKSIKTEAAWARTNFIRDTATLLYVYGVRNEPLGASPVIAWGRAVELWDAKPEDC